MNKIITMGMAFAIVCGMFSGCTANEPTVWNDDQRNVVDIMTNDFNCYYVTPIDGKPYVFVYDLTE